MLCFFRSDLCYQATHPAIIVLSLCFKSGDEYASPLFFLPPPLIAFELLSKLTKLSRNKAGPTWRLKQMQSDFSSVLLIKITLGLGCCTLTTDAIHPSRFKLSVLLLASWSVTVMPLATLSKTFSGLPGIIKPTSPHFKLDVPIWCNGWWWWQGGVRLISHNALSWWDNEKWP